MPETLVAISVSQLSYFIRQFQLSFFRKLWTNNILATFERSELGGKMHEYSKKDRIDQMTE